jgi:hypothetical protein
LTIILTQAISFRLRKRDLDIGSIKGFINLVVEFMNKPAFVFRLEVVLRSLKKGIGFCLSPF